MQNKGSSLALDVRAEIQQEGYTSLNRVCLIWLRGFFAQVSAGRAIAVLILVTASAPDRGFQGARSAEHPSQLYPGSGKNWLLSSLSQTYSRKSSIYPQNIAYNYRKI